MYLLPVFLPLISFFILVFFSSFFNKKILVYISTFIIFLSTFFSFLLIQDVINNNDSFEIYLFSWLSAGNLLSIWTINIEIRGDTSCRLYQQLPIYKQF